ncbi:hypothetical protein [Escherichia coli]|uniref:hypothetical protein n=1 Tax=Escherichia coli TaxID=562 RepID=UPI003F513CDB
MAKADKSMPTSHSTGMNHESRKRFQDGSIWGNIDDETASTVKANNFKMTTLPFLAAQAAGLSEGHGTLRATPATKAMSILLHWLFLSV